MSHGCSGCNWNKVNELWVGTRRAGMKILAAHAPDIVRWWRVCSTHKSCTRPCCKAFSPLVCLIFDVVARLGSECIRTDVFMLQDTLRYHFGHHLAWKRVRVFNLDTKIKLALFSRQKMQKGFSFYVWKPSYQNVPVVNFPNILCV